MPEWVDDPQKSDWKEGFKLKLNEMSYKEDTMTLSENELRHDAYDGKFPVAVFDPLAPVVFLYTTFILTAY